MSIEVICRYRDDSNLVISDQYKDLRDAVSAAIGLADLHGNNQDDHHGLPKRFDVYVDERLELSVAVIPGGLAA